jgi:tRNA threonylcarbamoyladenosine biosynthesis protein TsaE
MSALVFRTGSEEETIALGERIARGLAPPAVVLLTGELGAGKTTIAKGIVKGLGAAAPEDVSSPTFTLIHEYGDKPKVYHIDFYRIERAGEVLALGIEDLLDGDAVLLVEWGERFPALWPPDHIEIHLSSLDEQQREVTVTGP